MTQPYDQLDLKIMKLSSKLCKIKYTDIAKKLGLSHTAVRKRLTKLQQQDILKPTTTLNPHKLGFTLALLYLEVASDHDLENILDKFYQCPRIIKMYKITGEYNILAIIYAEDEKILDAILGECMLRTMPGIRRSSIQLVTDILIGRYELIQVPTSQLEKAPCGAHCITCTRYQEKKCPGCPATRHYRGIFSISTETTKH